MEQPIIIARHIGKSYGKLQALRDVSFTVRRGETFGLIGPDGAGKTSLFRILATLTLPDDGQATLLDKDTRADYASIRRRIGYMPGRFSLYPDLTVEENLRFYATLFGTSIEESYDLIRDIYTQIEPFRKRRAGKLSGGMKQKLALCCALVHKPEILLLDEPTTGVDPVSRGELWEMLGNLRRQGVTIVASTAYMDEARRCDRIAFLMHGEVQGIDTPEAILTRFADILTPRGLTPNRPMEQDNPAIEVTELTKTFGSFTAVDHLSFSVRQGEIFGFLGANGAGKTTAMRMLTGLSLPTSGKATVGGYDVGTQSEEIKRHIGYMSQKFSLYDDLTVAENIRLFAGIYGMKPTDIARHTDEVLATLGFTGEKHSLVRSLPAGWKQKLAFSVSIFHEPKIVFLDEPTGGVDPATRRQFWELIYKAAARGITIFVTTHYMDEAEYCDRVSMMVDGQIKALDTPAALKRRYHAANMDEVFREIARGATRKSD
ncbi:MAG: ATP-binding cassette domain-containing protein [Mediterranea sp.]|jgi:ABC-2 type transport system ATP-binding protein|nr:ATP-binding cassette domain-containing protein [Mediterranea sp.]